jgi:HEAT repeat protein
VPAIRRGAISLLATSPMPENLEVLTEMAIFGEDIYVRSHALLALGRTGLTIAAPLLRDALRSSESQERQSAEAGLRLLGRRSGLATLAALRQRESEKSVRVALGRVIATLTGARQVPSRPRMSAPESTRGKAG